MNRSDIVRRVREEYDRLRDDNARERDRRVREIIALAPEAEPLIFGGAALFQEKARRLLAHPEEAESLAASTMRRVRANDTALKSVLRRLGKDEDYLDYKYRCTVCRDTGYTGDDVRQECVCFTRRVAQLMSEASGADRKATFENSDPAIFPTDEKYEGMNQREVALAVMGIARTYADRCPDNPRCGLLIMGQTGLGKTYILDCIFNRLTDRGCAPVRVTAWHLFEAMQAERFATGDRGEMFRSLLSCGILLIDDLGSEPMVQNLTKAYLFTLLNERFSRKLSTVICTNLSQRTLTPLYGERIFSRLMDKNSVLAVELKGKDLRVHGIRR